MRWLRIPDRLLAGSLLLLGGGAGLLLSYLGQPPPQERTITISARKYAYDPPVLRVNRGDRLHLRLVSKDVTHGFYLEGYDVDAKVRPENTGIWIRRPSKAESYQEAEEIDFVAHRAGKFRYRCSITCGYMHPFMQGELIVAPNYLHSASLGLSLGLAVAMLLMFRRAPAGAQR